jgi:TolA-binding protein
MGLGGTAKKIQKLADLAEELYGRVNDIRDQIREMQETVSETSARVERLEAENAEQRALLEALAEEQGLDLDAIAASNDGESDASGDLDAPAEQPSVAESADGAPSPGPDDESGTGN